MSLAHMGTYAKHPYDAFTCLLTCIDVYIHPFTHPFGVVYIPSLGMPYLSGAVRLTAMQATCEGCGAQFDRRASVQSKYGIYCALEDCRRAWRARRIREYAATQRELGVDIWAPYRAGNQEARQRRIASGEEPAKRQRWPEAAARGDATRRARKAGTAPKEIFSRDEIGERDGWICWLCGEPIDRSLKWPDPRSASMDHVVALASGGAHARSNVRIAHLRGNIRRGAGKSGYSCI